MGGGGHVDEADRAGWVGPDERRVRREQAAHHRLGGALHRGDRRDAEALVQVGTRRVVDACDDVLDVKDLTCDARGNNVRVITRRDGRKRIRVLDVRLTQAVAVHAHARYTTTGKVRREARESLGILVNNRHGMTRGVQRRCQASADAPATHDHKVHEYQSTPVLA